MRKKITEIYEEREFFKTERDQFGNRSREPYVATVKRPVKVISGGARFGHYLIDFILLYAVNLGINMVLAIVSPEIIISMPTTVSYIISYLILVAYYFVMESTIQRTIGKFVTDSVVIDEYGNKPSNMTILGRSFARIIPFEAFSCLGERGWHDTLSHTFVVSKQEEATLKRLLSEQSGIMHVDDRTDMLD